MKRIEIIGNCDDYGELIAFVLEFDAVVFSMDGLRITKDNIGLVVDSDKKRWIIK